MEKNKNLNMDLQNNKLKYFGKPFIKDSTGTSNIMLDVIIALIPALCGSLYFFGLDALKLVLVSVISCVAFEYIFQKIFDKTISIGNLSAVVTGLLLAMNLPSTAPVWLAVFGAFFAIVIIKESFGGIGSNFINPALGTRAILMASWPDLMGNYGYPDMVSGPTPLSVLDTGTGALPSLSSMAMGNIGGVLGETSTILLLLGALYLIIKKVIDVRIPLVYLSTTVLALLVFGTDIELIPYHLLAGGLILGAFFMATDYSTIPYTGKGRIIFALGAGILTALIRVFGQYPEGVSYAILLMNSLTPLIDKYTRNRVYGEVK